MQKKILNLICYFSFLMVVYMLALIFIPRSYNVPVLKFRTGTQYWNLPTGSTIGYTMVAGKGKKRACPVIYLHGGPGGHVSDYNIKVLSDLSEYGYDIYFYDQVGSGQSARLENINQYTADRHVHDLEEILKIIKTRKVIIVGQSWGSILAVLFTAKNPLKVDKIVFTSPGPIFPLNKELAQLKAPDSLHLRNPVFTNKQGNKKAGNIRAEAMADLATYLGIKLGSDKEADQFETYLNYEVNKSVVADTSGIPGPEAGGGFYARVMTFNNLFRVQDPRPAIKKLSLPVLVMKAQYDNQKWGTTLEYCLLFSNHQLLIIPGAGHAMALEQPGLYLRAIRSFLNR